MTDKLQKRIKEEVGKLPKMAQDAINSFDWVTETEKIGKEFLLSDTDIHNLQVVTLVVVVGLEDIDIYARNIEDEVGTSRGEAEGMAGEAVKRIFVPIQDILNEKIKESIKGKKISPEQTMNFILSGGDYGAFLEAEKIHASENTPHSTTPPITPPSLADIQAGTQKQKYK